MWEGAAWFGKFCRGCSEALKAQDPRDLRGASFPSAGGGGGPSGQQGAEGGRAVQFRRPWSWGCSCLVHLRSRAGLKDVERAEEKRAQRSPSGGHTAFLARDGEICNSGDLGSREVGCSTVSVLTGGSG